MPDPNSIPLPLQQDAIILVPGMDGRQPGAILSKLERGLAGAEPDRRPQLKGAIKIGSRTGRALEYTKGQERHEVHLFEAYWGDTIDDLTKSGIRNQIVRGLKLLLTWVSFRALRLSGNRYLMIGGILTTLGLLLWWYGVTVSALTVVTLAGSEHTISDWLACQANNSNAHPWWKGLAGAASRMTEWWVGLGAMGLSALVAPALDRGVNVIHFANRYVEEDNLRQQLWGRLASMVSDLDGAHDYKRITILSHSFGTMIHVDWMADLQGDLRATIRHVTMAGPLAVMALKSPKIHDTMAGALRKSAAHGAKWYDFYSQQDWLCTATPDASDRFSFKQKEFQGSGCRIEHSELKFPGNLIQKLNGAHHGEYFRNDEILRLLLS